ncbi:PPE family protein [Mycobacterium tuberculosis]|nr:PPE family protein [Mycobacterium tuberculosis]
MSFLKTVPEELTAAAAQLGTIGAAMAAQNAAAAAPTTAIAPAALDEVSALQAALFTAYGTFYQQVSAEAQAMHDMFVNTLGISAGTYGVTESLNSSAAASPLSGITGEASAIIQATTGLFPPELSGGIGNILNIGAGNWASATSTLIGLAGGGLLPAEEAAEAASALGGEAALGELGALGAAEAALGEAGIAAGLGSASAIGMLSVPPRGRSSPGCQGWPRPHATAPASVHRATASNPSSCPSQQPSRRQTYGRPRSTNNEIQPNNSTETEYPMDFGALPPEINSARMYAGAGAGPMMAAGAAWNGLAAELGTTAASYESVITRLTTESWMGPASMAMVAAAQPYLAWLTYTAEAAAHAGSQAMASAAAYEAAYAMTVPPEVVAANRALLAALVATNVLGINTPAIMATEALYAEMWAQDALAMYGYAAASGAAGMLQPLSPPSQTTNPGGLAAQSAAVGSAAATAAVNQVSVADLISSLPNAVSGLASPVTSVLDSTVLSGIIADIDALLATPFVANIINSAVNTAAWYVNAAIPTAIFLANALNSGAPVAIAEGAIEAAEGAASAAAAGLADSVTPAGLGASLGEATLVGRLSVPAAWSTAAPATTAGATALEGSGWTVAAEEAGPVTGMMPGMASAAKGTGAYAGPRYGFKPTVMPKQVVV